MGYDCNDLHNGLQEMGELMCPFCRFQFNFIKKSKYYLFCCDKQDIINDNSRIVCQNCGIVQGFKHAKEYVNFYENRHRFRKNQFMNVSIISIIDYLIFDAIIKLI